MIAFDARVYLFMNLLVIKFRLNFLLIFGYTFSLLCFRTLSFSLIFIKLSSINSSPWVWFSDLLPSVCLIACLHTWFYYGLFIILKRGSFMICYFLNTLFSMFYLLVFRFVLNLIISDTLLLIYNYCIIYFLLFASVAILAYFAFALHFWGYWKSGLSFLLYLWVIHLLT